jgi:hypothetical protein
MKRFLIDTSVENAEGTQTWFVDAETEEEALDKFSAGGCDLYESNVDVTQCGEPEISGEVPLDDFGRFADQPPAAPPAQEQALPEFYAQLEYNSPDWDVFACVYRRRADATPELVHREQLPRQTPAAPVPLEDQRKLPENAARLIIEAWIKENYGDGYSYHLSDQDEGTSWAWWINSHPFEDPNAAMGFDGGTSWIDFEGKISDYSSIPDEFNTRMQAPPPAQRQWVDLDRAGSLECLAAGNANGKEQP